MMERPAGQRGIEVPIKLPSLVDDDETAKTFAENARKSLQR